ncbi:hypothetical protein QPK87_12950, partial [Kamptonema cortianum]|nr:hypothetical protein [Kamptonema cortianum]
MKQGETMKNREKERGILGRLRMQLIMVVMGGRNDAGSGSGEQFLGGDNHPESIGIDRRWGHECISGGF